MYTYYNSYGTTITPCLRTMLSTWLKTDITLTDSMLTILQSKFSSPPQQDMYTHDYSLTYETNIY